MERVIEQVLVNERQLSNKLRVAQSCWVGSNAHFGRCLGQIN